MKANDEIIFVSRNTNDMIIRLENGYYILISNDPEILGRESVDPFYLHSLICKDSSDCLNT